MRIHFNSRRDLAHPLAGGSEAMVDHLARGLAARGHEVTLRCAGPLDEHPYRVVPGGGGLSQFVRWPLDYLRSHRDAYLVVDVANGMTWFTPVIRRRPTLCLVHHVHHVQWGQWYRPAVAALGRTLEGRVMPAVYRNTPFATVSPSTAGELARLGVAPERITIVPNGVEVPETPAATSAEPCFVAVSRLVPHKRYDLLLEAWRRVHPHVGGRLLIAGEGPESARLAALAGPGVELLGRVDDATRDRLLGEAWVFVHTAEVEGWGLVVMEAAAHGTPTLALDALGVRDSVVDGVTGELATDVDDLVHRWVALAADPARRARLGAAARRRALAYSWDRTVDRFEHLAIAVAAGVRPALAPLGSLPVEVPLATVLDDVGRSRAPA